MPHKTDRRGALRLLTAAPLGLAAGGLIVSDAPAADLAWGTSSPGCEAH